MRLSRVNVNIFSMGLIVESEFSAWINVIAFVVMRSDYTPILSSVYGHSVKTKASTYEKIVEVPAVCKFSCNSSYLSPIDYLAFDSCFRSRVKLGANDASCCGFAFLNEFYDEPVIRYRAYANVARMQLHDLRRSLQRTHLNLSARSDV